MTQPYPWSADDLARELGVTERTIQRKARNREIPHLRVGRLIRFTQQHVQQILDAYQREALQRRPEADIPNPVYTPTARVVVPLRTPAA